MAPDRLSMDLGSVWEGLLAWANCIRSPATTCDALLVSDDRLQSAIRLWLATSIVALVINVPAYALVGIKVTEVGFFLSSLLGSLLALAALPSVIVVALRLHRIDTELIEVFIMYAVTVAAIAPIVTLLALPATTQMLTVVQSTKREHLQGLAAMRSIWSQLITNRPGDITPLLTAVVQPIITMMAFAMLALLSDFISQRYRAEKFKVNSALTLSVLLSIVPIAIVLAFNYFVLWAFVPS
jgi:hypothetical protein